MREPLLSVKKYSAILPTAAGVAHILNDVSFDVFPNECLGIIGESGCGKSMTAMSIMRYAERMGLIPVSGEIIYNGTDVLGYGKKELNHYNGGEISIIPQDPMTTLDPLFKVKSQMIETVLCHQDLSKEEALQKVLDVTKKLSIAPEKLDRYPYELSGGMLQRIVGAMALLCNAKIIIADEPTTALDVTIQLQYLRLLKRIQKQYGTSIIFISHDLHVISMMCDRIAVMYAGRIVETGTRNEIMDSPRHPYTKALLKSACIHHVPIGKYETIEGTPPDLKKEIKGCPFAARCPYANEQCEQNVPSLASSEDVSASHKTACWRILKS